MISTIGKGVNPASLSRGLDAQVAAGTIRSWTHFPNGAWLITLSSGESYTMRGLAQVHAVIVGLRSAELAFTKEK